MKVPYFHGIEVPFVQNLSALFGQCPLTFEVLPRPLCVKMCCCLQKILVTLKLVAQKAMHRASVMGQIFFRISDFT